jgi:hypothetical protein
MNANFGKFGEVKNDENIGFDYKLTEEDVKKAEESGDLFRLLPEGEYKFRVKEATESTSKAGNDQFVVNLRILDEAGEVAITDWIPCVKKAIWKVSSFLRAVGTIDIAQKEGIGKAFAQSVGMEGRLELTHEEYNGKDRNRVKRYVNPSEENAVK